MGTRLRRRFFCCRWRLALLWLRKITRWTRSLDERQRQIHTNAGLAAMTATCVVLVSVSLLQTSGILAGTRPGSGLGWKGFFAVLVFGYLLGCVRMNCRYR